METFMTKISLSRRSLIAAAAAVSAGGVLPRFSFAQSAPSTGRAPFFYSFKLGDLEGTVVSDGPVGPVGKASAIYAQAPKDDLQQVLANAFADDQLMFEQNILVLKAGDRLVLFDTGVGTSHFFGPNSGQLLQNLKAAGIDPNAINTVVLTHAHPDHCWQLVGEASAPNFPNAQIFMTEADFAFWTDEGKLSNDAIKGFIEGTRKVLLPLKEQITFVQDGKEVIPGIQAMATPGHTVGHTSYVLTAGNQSMLLIGDVVHHSIISTERPKFAFGFDTDANLGIETRLRTLDMLASTRMPVLSFHFPWPGLGHIGRAGDAYRFYPLPVRASL
jgi:glyoxylase-like metal-dependent hydrolase (beta-lactamase superfamily II)